MKIALCFSGHIRDLEETKVFWTEIIEKYKMDVYASFWDIENEELGDTINNFEKIYTPKRLEIDNYKIFKQTTQDIASLHIDPPKMLAPIFIDTSKEFRQLSMYYKVWKCNMLSKKLGIEYDLVIRARTDIALDENFTIEKNNMLNVPMGRIKAVSWDNSRAINDCFAYGIPKIMDYYSFVFLRAMEYLNSGHYLIPAEYLLLVHFTKIHIQIRYFPTYMIITRVWKGGVHEYYNNYITRATESIEWSDSYDTTPHITGRFNKDIKDEFIV